MFIFVYRFFSWTLSNLVLGSKMLILRERCCHSERAGAFCNV